MDLIDARVEEYARRAGLTSFAVAPESVSAVESAARAERLAPDAMQTATGFTALQSEKPEHVLMCYMLAGGKTRKEIAEAVGYNYQTVCNVIRQPFFRQRYLRIAKEAGMEATEAFLKGETMSSLEVLVEVRDTSEKGAERIAAANSILDRALGKAVVKVETKDMNNLDTAAVTKDAIEKELSKVRAEMKDRGITSGTN